MGVIKKGILGGFKGTVGTVVGANWRGMDIIRSRPKGGNSNPTVLQMLQRQKFSLAIKFQNALRAMQSRLYGENAGIKSRVNLAASYLLREVVTDINGQAVLQMDKVLITKGNLTGFKNLEVSLAANTALAFTWQDNTEQTLANPTDLFCVAIYEEESEEFFVQEGPDFREAGQATISLPEEWAAKTVHIYAFLQTASENTACTSIYLGDHVLT